MHYKKIIKAIDSNLDSHSPCAECENRRLKMRTAIVRQGEPHFSCDVGISVENLRRLKYFYKLLTEWMEAYPQISIQRYQRAECCVYQCLSLLKRLGAWDAVPQGNCKLLNQYPSGHSYPQREVDLFLTLGVGGQINLKEMVYSHVLNMLWYLNTRLLGRKRRRAEWMNREYTEPKHCSMSGRVYCFLLQNNIHETRLMFRCFDNTLEDGEVKHIADIFPEAVWQANDDSALEAFIYTSDDSLVRRLERGGDEKGSHVFVIIPVVPPDSRRPWRVELRKRVIAELSKLKFIENSKDSCRLMFIFEDSSLMKLCQNTMKLIAKKLSVKCLSYASDQEESLLSRLSKVEEDWEYSVTSDYLLSMPQGWWIVKRTSSKDECLHEILNIASDILSPPTIPSSPSDLKNGPVFITNYLPDLKKNEYVKKLKYYFDLEEIHGALTETLKITQRPRPKWEEQLQSGCALYEPPHGDSKHGYTWHEAHNAATFLILVTYMIKYLMCQLDEAIDVMRFKKDVRALTAKLNFRQKERINTKKAHPRGKYAPKDKDTLVRNEVSRLISSAMGGEDVSFSWHHSFAVHLL